MKVVLPILLGILILALAGGIGYVVFFMEDGPLTPPASAASSQPADTQQNSNSPQINTYVHVETDADMLEALDYEMTQNPDTVAWLEIPGTQISNSVLQAHDNNVYLRQNERREYDVYGCYFADSYCSVGARDLLSPNIIVYGHSDLLDNPDGPRFSQLFKFTDEYFARNTPIINFSTMDELMKWEIFAVFYTHVNFNYISAYPQDGVDVLAARAKELSLYDYGVEVGPEDNILTLSTCSVKYGADDYRLVVMAKLLPEGEEGPVTAEITRRTPPAPSANQEE